MAAWKHAAVFLCALGNEPLKKPPLAVLYFGCLWKVYFDFAEYICDNPPAYTQFWRYHEKTDHCAHRTSQHDACRTGVCSPGAGVRCGYECNWCSEQR